MRTQTTKKPGCLVQGFPTMYANAQSGICVFQFFLPHGLPQQRSKAVDVERRLKPHFAHDGMLDGHVGVLDFVQQYTGFARCVALNLPNRIQLVPLWGLNAKFSVESQYRRGKIVVCADDFHKTLNDNRSDFSDNAGD